MMVKDHYENFAGTVRWVIDKDGIGKISYDYIYTGNNLDSREVGIKACLPAECDEIKWRRWSEWGIFPEDSISRTEGNAKAKRDKKWPDQPANMKARLAMVAGPDRARDGRFPVHQVPYLRGITRGARWLGCAG